MICCEAKPNVHSAGVRRCKEDLERTRTTLAGYKQEIEITRLIGLTWIDLNQIGANGA